MKDLDLGNLVIRAELTQDDKVIVELYDGQGLVLVLLERDHATKVASHLGELLGLIMSTTSS